MVSTSGSRDDRAVEFDELVGTFSDWDARVVQEWLERQLRVWNPDLSAWCGWDQSTAGYTRVVSGAAGVDLPLDAVPVEVVSVVFAASNVTPNANLVYDPVGPYMGYLVHRFDPTDPSDVAAAAASAGYCPVGGCDYSVCVTRGGNASTYMLRVADAEGSVTPTDDAALRHTAINLPVSEGALQRVELLATPNAEVAGVPAVPVVLYTWMP